MAADAVVTWTFRAPCGSIASVPDRLYIDARERAAILLGAAPQDLRPVAPPTTERR